MLKATRRNFQEMAMILNDEEELPPPKNIREFFEQLIHSQKLHIGVVVLVLLDIVFVLGELFIDLKLAGNVHSKELEIVAEIFHFGSIAILTIFMIELAMKLYTLRLEFFRHKMEVFDGIVIIVAFILDIMIAVGSSLLEGEEGMGLLIILRLWRVARIINGIILSVKSQADKKAHKLKHDRDRIAEELQQVKGQKYNLDKEVTFLKNILLKHGITDVDLQEEARIGKKIDVIAEISENMEESRI